jgi:hypothetical protein
MKTTSALAYVGHNANGDRSENDFYATPSLATQELLKKECFGGTLWECACGDGAISKVLINNGYDVYSSDLINRGYGEQLDFLQSDKKVDNIITNPPFNLSTEFTLHALKLARKKIIMLNKLSFLEGIKRNKEIFSKNKLQNVYVFSKRLNFLKQNGKSNGLMAFAWFVFDNNYKGKANLEWI